MSNLASDRSSMGELFGLFVYTYDYYEWRDLVCVSYSKEALSSVPEIGQCELVEARRSKRDALQASKIRHYTIEPIRVV